VLLVLVLFRGALGEGLLEVLTWEMVAAGIAFIFLLRSLTILIGIWGMAQSVKLTWGYCAVAVLWKAVSDVERIGRIDDPHGGQP